MLELCSPVYPLRPRALTEVMMRSRQTPLEMFSTFLQFVGDRPSTWAIEARLQRSMRRCLAEIPAPESQLSATFWALYWYHVWHRTPEAEEAAAIAPSIQPPASLEPLLESFPKPFPEPFPKPSPQAPSLAVQHLSAYLQESCFWAAQKILTRFSTTQFTLSDCFQMGIVQVTKVLKGFNAKQGFSLENYASAIFTSSMRDSLRQQREIDICTPWALLRKTSQKRLEEALRSQGLSDLVVAQHILVWVCFKTLYVPTQATATRQLPKPDADTLAAIAHLYNRELNQPQNAALKPQSSGLKPPTPDLVEKLLTTCAHSARAYLNPTLLSMNTPKVGQATGELLDDIPESPRPSLLADLIAEEENQERHNQQTQLNTVLATAIAQFDGETQSLIQMYYGQNLTQQEMARRLDVKQYTVSRRLTRAREQLLAAIARWSQETLHISLNADLLSYTSTILEDWLQRHYGEVPLDQD